MMNSSAELMSSVLAQSDGFFRVTSDKLVLDFVGPAGLVVELEWAWSCSGVLTQSRRARHGPERHARLREGPNGAAGGRGGGAGKEDGTGRGGAERAERRRREGVRGREGGQGRGGAEREGGGGPGCGEWVGAARGGERGPVGQGS